MAPAGGESVLGDVNEVALGSVMAGADVIDVPF